MVLASLATAQVATLQIQIVEGDGAVYAPGARSARPLVVEVTDENGRPVPGAAVSFHLPEDGPSGSFANGLRTDVVVTDERGRAALRSMQLNRMPGRFQIRIIASKEQATAGTVAFQSILDPAGGAVAAGTGSSKSAPAQVSSGSGHKKLILILAGVGAGAAVGLLAMHSGGSAASSSSSNSAGGGAGVVPTTIGTPSITISKP